MFERSSLLYSTLANVETRPCVQNCEPPLEAWVFLECLESVFKRGHGGGRGEGVRFVLSSSRSLPPSLCRCSCHHTLSVLHSSVFQYLWHLRIYSGGMWFLLTHFLQRAGICQVFPRSLADMWSSVPFRTPLRNFTLWCHLSSLEHFFFPPDLLLLTFPVSIVCPIIALLELLELSSCSHLYVVTFNFGKLLDVSLHLFSHVWANTS